MWIAAIYEQHKNGVTVKHADIEATCLLHEYATVPTEKDQVTNIQNAYIALRAERSDTYFQYLFFLRFFFSSLPTLKIVLKIHERVKQARVRRMRMKTMYYVKACNLEWTFSSSRYTRIYGQLTHARNEKKNTFYVYALTCVTLSGDEKYINETEGTNLAITLSQNDYAALLEFVCFGEFCFYFRSATYFACIDNLPLKKKWPKGYNIILILKYGSPPILNVR